VEAARLGLWPCMDDYFRLYRHKRDGSLARFNEKP
jgi:hypothetical protein